MSVNILPTKPNVYRSTVQDKTDTTKPKAEATKPDTETTRQDTVKIGSEKTDKANTYTPPKKLSGDQMSAIREQLTQQQQQLLQAMAGNAIGQANSWLASLGGNSKFAGIDLGGMKLPPLVTDPEGAKAAISEGGAYSVDAVATRIFDMAKSMAGDDPAMLEKMRKAVQDGFKAAGVDFKKATGQGLPDISSQTYDEVMKRFDERAAELGATE